VDRIRKAYRPREGHGAKDGRRVGQGPRSCGEWSWLQTDGEYIYFYICLPLKSHVLALSPTVMEALLASDALDTKTENEVYTLLGSWLYQSPYAGAYDGEHPVTVEDCLPLFRRLVSSCVSGILSFDFVANVITACPLAENSGLLSSILRLSLATRETDPNVVAEWRGIDPVPRDRGRGGLEWIYTSTLDLADLLSLAEDTSLDKYMGQPDGYPIFI